MKINFIKRPPADWKITQLKIIFILIGVVIFCVDRVCKIHFYNVYINHFENYRHVIIPNFLVLETHLNSGIAFGWLQESWIVTIFLPSIVLIVLIGIFIYTKYISVALSCILIIFGGFSNLLDRIYDGHNPLGKGEVLDLFNILNTKYVFNVADMSTSFGTFILVISMIFFLFQKNL